jgi:hypothetical protein
MSAKLKTISIVSAIIVFVCGYFYTQVDWEARAIRKQFSELVDLVEKEGAVSTFEALARSRQLPNYFTEDAMVEYLAGRSFPKGTDGMGRAFLAAWSQLDSAAVSILRHEVEINENYPEAKSRVSANCRVVFEGRDQMRDTVQYQIYWRKVEGDWLIRQIVATGVL